VLRIFRVKPRRIGIGEATGTPPPAAA